METLLIWLVVLVVAAGIAYALLQWSQLPINPVVYTVGGWLLVGIVLVVLIRFLWPILVGGELPALK